MVMVESESRIQYNLFHGKWTLKILVNKGDDSCCLTKNSNANQNSMKFLAFQNESKIAIYSIIQASIAISY